MPELPEVETIRQDLRRFILNKKIRKLEIFLPRLIKSDPKKFYKIICGNSFKEISRTGKLLIFNLSVNSELFLLIHLKMTGQLVFCSNQSFVAGGHSTNTEANCKKTKHTHVIFSFEGGDKLYFNDIRTFGLLKLVNKKELETIKSGFGIEPLQTNFTFSAFYKILKKRKINIKSVLLNQQLISGIGNIYADEILFSAKVNPARIANSLNELEIKKIFTASNKIIKEAIKKRGTTFNNYVDGQGLKGSYIKKLQVYGRAKEKCYSCQGVLEKIKVAGRGTVFCSTCQK